MKEKKSLRLIVILLTICLVLGQVKPIPLYADSGATEVVTLDSSSGSIEPGSLESKVKETEVTDPSRVSELHISTDISGELNSDDIAYLNKLVNIKVLNIGNTITIGDLGDNFMNGLGTTNFDALESVSLPTAISFGDNAFRHCDRLTSVSLPGVTSFGDNAFRQCVALEAIDLPAVTSFGTGAFTSCSVLNSVNLPLVESFEDFAFSSCLGLVSIDLPEVKSFGDYTLLSCFSLESVSLPKVSSFGKKLFDLCGNLSELTLGSNPPSVGGWGDYGVSPRTLDVPSSAVNVYDGDQQTWSSPGTNYDGLWEGWTLPKTIIRLDASNGAEFIAGSLQDRVEAFGVTDARQVNELYIEDSVTGEFNQNDIDYLNCMFNLEVLDVATSIEVADVGDDFMRGSYTSPYTGEYIAGTEALGEVTFPARVFGNRAFKDCSELESVSLPLAISFEDYAFHDCSELESVSLPLATTFGGYAFHDCSELESVSLPLATTFGEKAFYACSELESVSLPLAISFGDWAFVACSELKSISLPLVTIFGNYAFRECNELESVSLPLATTFEDWAFVACSELESVSLPLATTFGNYAFYDCSSLESVSLPSAITFGEGTFKNCTKLKELTLGRQISTVQGWGTGFTPGTLNIPSDVVNAYDGNQQTWSPAGTEYDGLWEGWTLPKTIIRLDASNGAEFAPGSLQDRVEAFGITDARQVNELYIDSSVTGEFNQADIDYLNAMFNLEVLNVATSIEVAEVGDDFMRGGYTSPWGAYVVGTEALREVKFPAKTFGNSAFHRCSKLESVSLPLVTTFGNNAFNGCSKLESISLPSAITFGYLAFDSCSKLESVSLPSATTFGSSAFACCSELESISLPSATTFGMSAFVGCYELESISLPLVTTIRTNAFDKCTSLSKLTLGSQIPMAEGWGELTPGTLYIPSVAMNAYDKDHQSWQPTGTDTDGLWEGWTLVSICTVTFSSQEGTRVDEQEIIAGDYILKPADPTRAGFTFGGWYTSSDCKDDDRWNFNYSPVIEDLTLYAKWIADVVIANYTVEFNSQEGSAVASQTVQNGDYAIEPLDPTKSGNTFAGWYTSSTCDDNDRWNFATSQVIGDTTLYAKWIPDAQVVFYDVDYDSQNGSQVASEVVQANDYATEPNQPTRDGFTFGGWYTSSECKDGDRWNFHTSQVIGDTILYANWIPDAQVVYYDVDYDSQNGSQVAGESVQENDYATEPIDPTRDGYSFGGWYTTSDCHDGDRWNFNTSQVIGDTTLYAKWIANAVIVDYTVEFNSQEGSAVASQTVQNGDYITEPANPTRTGYSFEGWYTTSTCNNGDAWNFDLIPIASDMILYAKWDSTATEKVVVKKYITEYVTSPSEDDDEEDLGDLTEDIPESVLEAESNDPIFTDIINHWGQEAIEALAKLDIVNGIGNGLFNPDGTISRAEFVTMIVRYFELEAFATDLGFTDVEESDWFSEYVWIARENDILPEFYGSEFEPHTAVTREEMMFILYKTLVLTDRLGDYPDGGDSLSDFTDGELVAEYATTSCEYLISRDIINGRGNGSLNPQGTSSRAEVCQMLWNMIKK